MLTSKLQYFWDGSLQELKSFVYDKLDLKGKWFSPGGEVKLFVISNVSFKWYGPTQKRLVILKDDEKNSLIKALMEHAIHENDSVGPCSAKRSQVDTSREKPSCESCTKHELAITELQLDMAVLSELFHKEQENLGHQVSRISNVENSIQGLSRVNEEKSADFELIKMAVNDLTCSESTKRIEKRNSTKLVRLRSAKDSVHTDHPIPTTQDATDTELLHINSVSEMNDRNAKEITRPSRQSVVEKEPRFIYRNNNQLFQNSVQQVDLTSSQPTPPNYTH